MRVSASRPSAPQRKSNNRLWWQALIVAPLYETAEYAFRQELRLQLGGTLQRLVSIKISLATARVNKTKRSQLDVLQDVDVSHLIRTWPSLETTYLTASPCRGHDLGQLTPSFSYNTQLTTNPPVPQIQPRPPCVAQPSKGELRVAWSSYSAFFTAFFSLSCHSGRPPSDIELVFASSTTCAPALRHLEETGTTQTTTPNNCSAGREPPAANLQPDLPLFC